MELINIGCDVDDILNLHGLSAVFLGGSTTGASEVGNKHLCRLRYEEQCVFLDQSEVIIKGTHLPYFRLWEL